MKVKILNKEGKYMGKIEIYAEFGYETRFYTDKMKGVELVGDYSMDMINGDPTTDVTIKLNK